MKHKLPMLFAGLSAILFAGCQSKEVIPVPKEFTSVPLYMAGQEIPGDSQEKYLSNATVKMYSIGRLVDPGSGTMREAGTVYRIETAPKWNLIPQYDANPESFAKRKLQEQYADSMIGQMNRSLSETREVKRGLSFVQQDMSAIERKCQDLSSENLQLRKELKKQSENTVNLLNGIKKMQKYVELLEQRFNDRNTMDFGGMK